MVESNSFIKKIQTSNFIIYIALFIANIASWVVFSSLAGYNSINQLPGRTLDPFNYLLLLLFFIFASIITAFISGMITDKTFNRIPLIVIGFILFSVSFILLIISYSDSHYIYIFLAYLFAGSGFGLNLSALGAFFGDITEPKDRGKLQGISLSLGYLFALFILNIQDLIAAIAILIGFLFVVTGTFISFSRKTNEKRNREKNTPMESFIDIFTKKNYLYYVFSFLLFLIALPIINILFEPLFVTNRITTISLQDLSMIYYLIVPLFAIIGGITVDRFGRKAVILFLFLTLGFGFVIWGITPEAVSLTSTYLVFIAIFLSAGNSLTNIFDYTISSDFAEPRSRGRLVSLFFIASNVGLIISTILRQIIEELSIATIALIVTFFLLLSIVPIVLATKSLDEALAKQVSVKGIFIVTQDGRCMVDATFKGISVETDLITGALSAVGDLIKESVHSQKQLKTIDQEDVKIMISYGDHVNACLIADKETKELRERLDKFLDLFEDKYKDYVVEWSGALRPFMGAYKIIEEIFGVYI
ncbi:MAG: MFS transporter [Candidatus Lokiarchaeota archaeon]|nr:MFS transporter [Candidatus Lokiarchaeota archaeon]